MAATYSLLATECPPLVAPGSLLDPSEGTPTTLPSLVEGTGPAAQSAVAKWNQGFATLDVLGRHGGGGYSIREGLTLEAAGSGLTLEVAAGQAMLDGPVTLAAAEEIALTDAVYNWVWLQQDGSLTKTTSASATPVPAAPADVCVFLGRVLCSGGNRGEPDYSGRPTTLSGYLLRRTGDSGKPGDTPSSSLRLYTRTLSGLWFWDGTAYYPAGGPLPLIPMSVPSGDEWTIPSGYALIVPSGFETNGTLTVDGLLITHDF